MNIDPPFHEDQSRCRAIAADDLPRVRTLFLSKNLNLSKFYFIYEEFIQGQGLATMAVAKLWREHFVPKTPTFILKSLLIAHAQAGKDIRNREHLLQDERLSPTFLSAPAYLKRPARF